MQESIVHLMQSTTKSHHSRLNLRWQSRTLLVGRLLVAICLAVAVAGCGGGGGSNTPSVPTSGTFTFSGSGANLTLAKGTANATTVKFVSVDLSHHVLNVVIAGVPVAIPITNGTVNFTYPLTTPVGDKTLFQLQFTGADTQGTIKLLNGSGTILDTITVDLTGTSGTGSGGG